MNLSNVVSDECLEKLLNQDGVNTDDKGNSDNMENSRENNIGNPHFIIEGGKPITGTISANGAKNAALPIIAGTILAPGNVVLDRVPEIADVKAMVELMSYLGAKVDFIGPGKMSIDTTDLVPSYAPYHMVKKLNASFDITGAMVARFGEAHVPLPGGCVIGTRAVDQHLDGFKALGCEVRHEPGGFIEVRARQLIGSRFRFRIPSVGATKNVMMAACLARGKTILENVAREPEVVDLANFLNAAGANITGQGSSQINITGVGEMSGNNLKYSIIPDRIETGTYLLAAAVTQGDVKVTGINSDYLKIFLNKLKRAGQEVIEGRDFIQLRGKRPIERIGAVITEPYPGFPTDLQPQMVVFLSLANGTSFVKEKIFDMRFNYMNELRRMGAEINVKGNTASIDGVNKLMGAPVDAPDIRAGSALVLAALAAEGTTEIYGLHFIDRGYEKLEEKLYSLGANIRRITPHAHRH
jgi:UDP-N-acetylglucosamine 1-carboxyvinyltransferase